MPVGTSKLGDFADPRFRQWIDFRIETITEFMREIDRNAKDVNPKIMTIPEIYPGIERAAVVVGADVYQLYGVTDAIAHEYEFGGGNHMATSRTPLDWFRYQVGMRSFRAFAQGKATWILNYSWDGDEHIAPPEPMMNLAMSVVMAGANFWDAATHVMSGSERSAYSQADVRAGSRRTRTRSTRRARLFIRSACTSRHRPGTIFRTSSCAPTRAWSSCCCRRIGSSRS